MPSMRAFLRGGLQHFQIPHKGLSQNARFLVTDSRSRLSRFWAPTGNITLENDNQHLRSDASQDLLVRGGFLRQAHSGVFHLLPLGLRVQDKLERLIDKHMASIGASKLSLSAISTEALWKQSGRFSANSELLRLNDRKDSGFLLSPTHEEEITAMVADIVHSYKDLPVRLYQIGRKYRDERRPRGGLLRAKEFLMKDLYTFDHSPETALGTYDAVRMAYINLLDELKIPYLVAEADSGNMGGNLSHEYHFASPSGEDQVWSCDSCEYVANDEVVEKRILPILPPKENIKASEAATTDEATLVVSGISVDRTTKINIHIPRPNRDTNIKFGLKELVNLHAVKRAGFDLDSGIEPDTVNNLLHKTTKTADVFDCRLPQATFPSPVIDLTITKPGAPCPKCEDGRLHVQHAVEVGHTFHLGTRYSKPLKAVIAVPDQKEKIPIQMGCHGIGVSRIIGTVASLLRDERGLNWPRILAPYEVVILTSPQVSDEDGVKVYDTFHDAGFDVVLDDRPTKSLAWKLRDADLIGYPIIIVLGKAWREHAAVELQCRRLRVKESIQAGLCERVSDLLDQL